MLQEPFRGKIESFLRKYFESKKDEKVFDMGEFFADYQELVFFPALREGW